MTGDLGPLLREIHVRGRGRRRDARRQAIDHALLHVLGAGREPTARRLAERPAFEEFEAWVAERNGGALAPWQVERALEIGAGAPRGPSVARRLAEVEAMEPVLSDADLRHWDEHGYVILRGALPSELCERIERAVWRALGADPAAPETWYDAGRRQGIMVQLFDDPAQREARELPRIHKAFAQLWGTADLVTTTDRAGFNPPEREDARFPGPYLHWDLPGFEPPLRLDLQGIAYLTDTPAEQGAFRCVPGFHRRIEGWLAELPDGADPRAQDLEALGPQAIAAGAGDLIVWHGALPHGASPNRGERPRIVQYLKMFPAPAARQAGSTE